MKLNERDKKIIWHPFTQEKTAGLPIVIKKAKGSYLYDENGKSYLDLISSWWVNLHGHAHPEIAKAIYDQASTLEHVVFAGFTHEPAVHLCEGLKELIPLNLSRFFFSDNGSTSIEVSLKMAYQYWWNHGERDRTLFLSFDGGYHGDTFGAMSVGARSGFHNPFSKLFFDTLTIPFPATWDNDNNVKNKEAESLEALSKHLKNNPGRIAAIILEPLIQGASGMRICNREFLKKVIELVRFYGILVIFDEVMTGFGRTGTYFALEQIDLVPDFLCISKGITGGFLPLALTITTEEVYKAFLGEHFINALAHGHSYTANPIACAAAIASLRLLVKPTTLESINGINQAHHSGISYLKTTCHNIINTRIIGTISAFEVDAKCKFNLNQTLKTRFLEEGLLLRPLGNTVYLLPPYSTKVSDLEVSYEKISKVLISLS